MSEADAVRCSPRLEAFAVPGVPVVRAGDDLARTILDAFDRAGEALRAHDVVAIASKLLSRSEGRFVDLTAVEPSPRARDLAKTAGKDPRLVELILSESSAVSRVKPNVIVVRHRLGFFSANAGIDASNASPPDAAPGSGPWVLLLPTDPDATAARLRSALEARFAAPIGVVITDSFGRPFRLGTVGAAIGVAGVPAIHDQRGRADLFGRALEHTITALADQIAAAADLVAGQADEARPIVVVRGLEFTAGAATATDLLRPTDEDLYA
jgi:coenzyme F420-0:L-glutamate ligase/coenzyme F420-1:gamma-L-glutamate ligase